jgi:hypothetical protein
MLIKGVLGIALHTQQAIAVSHVMIDEETFSTVAL